MTLYKHQQEAVDAFKDADACALFFEMGCGKSATILAMASHKFEAGVINALLIVAPNGVHKQWADEQIPTWLTVPYELQCFGGRGGAKTTHPFYAAGKLHILCVNIDTFSTPAKWQDIVEWHNYMKTMLILDEATAIKNVNAARTQRLLYAFNDVQRKKKTVIASKPKSIARAILTGTPVTNGPMDLWSMMEFLKPNYFGRNYYSFQNYFGMFTSLQVNNRTIAVPLSADKWEAIKGMASAGEARFIFGCNEDTYNTIQSQDHYEGPHKHAEELRALLQPVSRFKLLKECVDMPAQNYVTHDIIMSDEQQQCYDDMVADYVAEYDGVQMTALNKMTVIIRLQQISSGFLVERSSIEVSNDIPLCFQIDEDEDIKPDEIKWIGKSNPKLDRLYSDVAEAAKPLIVVTRFSCEAARIFDDLSKSYSCCLMTGWKKVGTVDEFKAGKYEVMVANVRVISRGFNLQNSHTMLFYSNTFSLEDRLQVEGRIFRIGQSEPCQYIDYINHDSVDEKIVTSLQQKQKLLDFIRGGNIMELLSGSE